MIELVEGERGELREDRVRVRYPHVRACVERIEHGAPQGAAAVFWGMSPVRWEARGDFARAVSELEVARILGELDALEGDEARLVTAFEQLRRRDHEARQRRLLWGCAALAAVVSLLWLAPSALEWIGRVLGVE